MTGEMSASEVTRENYPLYFAIADALGGTVHPFDQYQGPYVRVNEHRLWLVSEGDGSITVYDETTKRSSEEFLLFYDDDVDGHAAIDAAVQASGFTVKECPICK